MSKVYFSLNGIRTRVTGHTPRAAKDSSNRPTGAMMTAGEIELLMMRDLYPTRETAVEKLG